MTDEPKNTAYECPNCKHQCSKGFLDAEYTYSPCGYPCNTAGSQYIRVELVR